MMTEIFASKMKKYYFITLLPLKIILFAIIIFCKGYYFIYQSNKLSDNNNFKRKAKTKSQRSTIVIYFICSLNNQE
jgi:hypothetical protein